MVCKALQIIYLLVFSIFLGVTFSRAQVLTNELKAFGLDTAADKNTSLRCYIPDFPLNLLSFYMALM
jgi:hypothetical protein